MHWRQVSEARRNLDHRLVDEHRNRVQVPRQGRQPKPLGFERNGPATSERVQDRRRSLWECPVDLGSGLRQHIGVVGVLPLDQPFQDPKQTLPLGLLRICGRQQVAVGVPVPLSRRIVHQRSPDHRPSRSERPPRPPQMQRRRVPVPDRFLPCRLGIDHGQRQRYLNQLRSVLPGRHGRRPYLRARALPDEHGALHGPADGAAASDVHRSRRFRWASTSPGVPNPPRSAIAAVSALKRLSCPMSCTPRPAPASSMQAVVLAGHREA